MTVAASVLAGQRGVAARDPLGGCAGRNEKQEADAGRTDRDDREAEGIRDRAAEAVAGDGGPEERDRLDHGPGDAGRGDGDQEGERVPGDRHADSSCLTDAIRWLHSGLLTAATFSELTGGTSRPVE